MTFEEFLKYCSVDFTEESSETTNVMCIFSSAYRKEYGTEFYKYHTGLANRLVAHDLYDYLCKEFGNNG